MKMADRGRRVGPRFLSEIAAVSGSKVIGVAPTLCTP